MKGYGLPRTKDLMYPDVDDINTFGLASHVGQIVGKSGDYHGGRGRKKMRRLWKKKERARMKNELKDELE